MASFMNKRQARVIKVSDEDVDPSAPSDNDATEEDAPRVIFGTKTGKKPFRQSGLRKSFNPADGDVLGLEDGGVKLDDEADGPVVVRPNVSMNRSGSLKQKKRKPKSRLSFGGDAMDAGEDEAEELSTPKRAPLGWKAMENSAARRGVPLRGLAGRTLQDDDEKPRYSKEYLSELQSSTPNTPRDISTLHIDDADDMELDESELEGALIVEAPAPSPKPTTQILTDVEIRERKERRARLAKEQGFLSVEDDDDEDRPGRKKKADTRLLAEDEDLGEGFDDFVEDGGLSLGKRAERERRKQQRRQMAELISAAEGHTSDSSSDSDAERRIAYESAQTRAGLDGLEKPKKNAADELLRVPPKITPLPNLTECLARLQATLAGMEVDIESKKARIEQIRCEKEDIAKREAEVQALLDETGRKYQEAMNRGAPSGAARGVEGPVERGLESLGTTPMRVHEDMDVS
ncbi:hypothetical protein DCS_04479 [Drechmeria coniospora]|uniref:Nineteen complex-related protein 2 domain-containing protein n=1 Tax=Drechmeria coniospora TaxID=98403 RepID=A0A151GK49_DRECN|nr:hypothetical protein DCS_04479 [Drechmeria coniospora]KYK57469.1 hypothetical protein DCS_04479 [Drechmeria coniospora]ODA79375.1 hypothetical protein RJ55_04968 [Drechmeria coniospora]